MRARVHLLAPRRSAPTAEDPDGVELRPVLLSDDELQVLGLGPNFRLPARVRPVQFMGDFERALFGMRWRCIIDSQERDPNPRHRPDPPFCSSMDLPVTFDWDRARPRRLIEEAERRIAWLRRRMYQICFRWSQIRVETNLTESERRGLQSLKIRTCNSVATYGGVNSIVVKACDKVSQFAVDGVPSYILRCKDAMGIRDGSTTPIADPPQ